MQFGLFTLGVSAFQNSVFVLDSLTSYTKITFYGQNTGAIFDKIWGRNMVLTKEYLDSIAFETFNPTWIDNRTYMLADFESHEASAGNVSGLNKPIENWVIYRQVAGTSRLEYLKTVPVETTFWKDYLVVRDVDYIYYLFAQSEDIMSNALLADGITASYDANFLINATDNEVFLFNYNTTENGISMITNTQEYNTNNKYHSYSKGQTNYASGTMSGIVLNSANYAGDKIVNTVAELQKVKDLIYDDTKIKFVKTRKGEIYRVMTDNYVDNVINEAIGSQPINVSFTYKEIKSITPEQEQ